MVEVGHYMEQAIDPLDWFQKYIPMEVSAVDPNSGPSTVLEYYYRLVSTCEHPIER